MQRTAHAPRCGPQQRSSVALCAWNAAAARPRARRACRGGEQRCRRTQAAATSDAGLSTSSSSLLGSSVETKAAPPSTACADVPLNSQAGLDYTKLRDLLANDEFQAADDETRDALIRLAGLEAMKRKWVYFSEVKSIPAEDLRTIDALWRAASGGRFGYSVQKELWLQNRRQWTKFFRAIDWTTGEHNFYRKWPGEFKYNREAAKGHLPLTNALRGTQLFKAIMEHPAFERPPAAGAAVGNGAAPASGSNPDWLK